MILLYEPSQISSVRDPDIRQLLEMRFGQLGSVKGFIVVEQGDSVNDLETISGCPILRDLFDECRFPDDDFAPSFEVLEDHGNCYEMVFIFTDDGCGVELFIPKQDGIDSDLLSLCQTFAIPATSSL